MYNLACVSQSLNKSVTRLTWFYCSRFPGVPSVQRSLKNDEITLMLVGTSAPMKLLGVSLVFIFMNGIQQLFS